MSEINTTIKRTPFYQIHLDLGAKMVPFAGFEMPLQYSGLIDEHHAVRRNSGMFDVSHMGEFIVRGPQALDFLQWVTSNDVSKLVDGKVQYSCLPNGEGGIVDDLLVYRIKEDEYMLVVNASNIDKDLAWLGEQNEFEAEIFDVSDEYALLAVQGPNTASILQELTDIDLSSMAYYTFQKGSFAGVSDLIISATGYTGAGGFELYLPAGQAEAVWKKIMEVGLPKGLKPAGLAARDTLRLEMGFCLYGNDIDDGTSPIEAGLGWITKFSKDFIDKDRLLAQKENGCARKLVAFELQERGIPRQGYDLVDADGTVIGRVTSGTMSPSTGKAIGMGYVNTGHHRVDSEIFVHIRNKQLSAKVVKLPFYKGEEA